MIADDLVRLLEERPFRPLRLYLADGRVREIRHPEMALVSDTLVAIGMPKDTPSKVVELTFCSIPNIVEVERFDSANGSSGKEQ
jgi:hypothetical protein